MSYESLHLGGYAHIEHFHFESGEKDTYLSFNHYDSNTDVTIDENKAREIVEFLFECYPRLAEGNPKLRED